MGQRDLAQNDYFNDNRRFADLCNGILFDGEAIVRAEELLELDTDMVYRTEGGRRKSIPDKIRLWHGMYLAILALENQTMVDYSMVFRMMKMEAAAYEKQWKQRERLRRQQGRLCSKERLCWKGKHEKFIPVVTIVVYMGTDREWDAATCLYEMLEVEPKMKALTTNYRINVFDYHHCNDFSIFKTENRELFEILSCVEEEGRMDELIQNNRERFDRLDQESLETIYDIAGIKEKDRIRTGKEEEETMCKAWDDHKEKGRMEGREEGRQEGRQEGRLESVRSLMKKLHMTAVQAMEILDIEESERGKYFKILNE